MANKKVQLRSIITNADTEDIFDTTDIIDDDGQNTSAISDVFETDQGKKNTYFQSRVNIS